MFGRGLAGSYGPRWALGQEGLLWCRGCLTGGRYRGCLRHCGAPPWLDRLEYRPEEKTDADTDAAFRRASIACSQLATLPSLHLSKQDITWEFP